MHIEMRDIEELKPYPNNPRRNDKAIAAVATSIQTYGFRQPMVVDKLDNIVIGHTRYLAARKLGLQKVPVHVAHDLTEAQAKAYRIADNKTAELSEWDHDRLVQELLELEKLNVDPLQLGFDADELQMLYGIEVGAGLTDPDNVPEPSDAAITQPGDIWILGEHRLLCGDSSKAEDVDRLLAGAAIHLVNSDPPYNVKVEPRSCNAIAAGNSSFAQPPRKRTHHQGLDIARHPHKAKPTGKMRPKDRPLENDFLSDKEFARHLSTWFGNFGRVLLPGRSFWVWGGYGNLGNYPPALAASDLYFSQAVIWTKNQPVLTRKDMLGAHELCFYGWRKGKGHHWFGPNNIRDVWEVSKVPSQKMVHLTEKPVELAVRALQYSSRAGENVLDLFAGSGSSLVACEQTGRRAYLMEIDPLYCDVIVARFEQFTGKKAVRQPAA